MHSKQFLMLLLSAMTIASCTSDDESGLFGRKTQVTLSVDEFKNESGTTKTNCDPDNNFSITWADGDTIGIFPYEGDQEPFVIPASQVGQSNASFDGGSWALKEGKKYNAYYPFNMANFSSSDSKTTVPVSYIGQSQTGTTCNVGAFDYTYSDWQTSTGGQAVNFNFHHIGSFLVLNLELPITGSYTSLTLKTANAVIPTQGTYDLTADAPAFVATSEKANSLTMELKNFTGTAGETAVFYMMIPPMDFSAETPTVVLANSTGSCTYTIPELSKTIEAATLYERTGTLTSEWEEVPIPYLTFSADSEQTVCFTDKNGESTSVATVEYSLNGGDWTEMGTSTITFGGDYGQLRLRGKSSTGTASTYESYAKLSFGYSDIPVSCSGDIRTLVDYSNYNDCDTSNARFCFLFEDGPITSAPTLPAMTLADDCYTSMFASCTKLTTAPTLPATTLADYCYNYMFDSCENLTTAPTLPATALATGCYSGMFSNCTSLTTAPALPATELATGCYSSMFDYCENLTTAPALPATELAEGCYSGMFSNCTSLTSAPVLPATTLAAGCYFGMFVGCTSLTTAPVLPATTLVESCYQQLFYGCSNLSYIKMMATNISATDCLSDWVDSVASTGTFVKNSAATWSVSGTSGIPSGWTVETADE